MPRRKRKTVRISVFKGREAKLNKVVFHILALKGPRTIYDIHKTVKTWRRLRHVRYASVNKRVRSLQESGYIEKIGLKKTKAGFKASTYELTSRAYLALVLDSLNFEEVVLHVDDASALAILAPIIQAGL